MTQLAIFHSVLGVRPGIEDAAARLRAAGHGVRVVDQYDGRTFDDYAPAMAYSEQDLGFPELTRRGLAAVEDLPDGFVAMGFSNGAAMAEIAAYQRRLSGVVLHAGAMPPSVLAHFGAIDVPEGEEPTWPAELPVQVHEARDDPFKEDGSTAALGEAAIAAGARFEAFEYDVRGHLFTDPSLPGEHQAAATELVWERVLQFLHEIG